MTVIGSDRWRLPVRWTVLVDILGLAARPRTSTTPKAPFPSPFSPSLPLLHQIIIILSLVLTFLYRSSCFMSYLHLLSGLYVSLFRFSTVWCDSDVAYSFFFLSTSPTSIASKWRAWQAWVMWCFCFLINRPRCFLMFHWTRHFVFVISLIALVFPCHFLMYFIAISLLVVDCE